jgi:hypothetical protein
MFPSAVASSTSLNRKSQAHLLLALAAPVCFGWSKIWAKRQR